MIRNQGDRNQILEDLAYVQGSTRQRDGFEWGDPRSLSGQDANGDGLHRAGAGPAIVATLPSMNVTSQFDDEVVPDVGDRNEVGVVEFKPLRQLPHVRMTRHTFTRERRASSRQSAWRHRRGRVPHQFGRPRKRNGR